MSLVVVVAFFSLPPANGVARAEKPAGKMRGMNFHGEHGQRGAATRGHSQNPADGNFGPV